VVVELPVDVTSIPALRMRPLRCRRPGRKPVRHPPMRHGLPSRSAQGGSHSHQDVQPVEFPRQLLSQGCRFALRLPLAGGGFSPSRLRMTLLAAATIMMLVLVVTGLCELTIMLIHDIDLKMFDLDLLFGQSFAKLRQAVQ